MPNYAHFAGSAALAALAAAAISCGSVNAPAGVGRDMATFIPADSLLLAGLNLDEVRASPLYPKLPAAARALAEPLRDAGYLLLASCSHNIPPERFAAEFQPAGLGRVEQQQFGVRGG